MNVYSLVLAIGAVNGLILATLLLRSRHNTSANRILAAVIACVLARLLVYIIGYAGAYDAWPWLTFAPLDWSLAFGPLIWLYVDRLTKQGRQTRSYWHFAPLALQVAYQIVCFCLPMTAKWNWYTGADRTLVEPIMQTFGCLQLGVYLAMAVRNYRVYSHWLDAHLGNTEKWQMRWLGAILAAFGVYWLFAVITLLWNSLIYPLDYFQRLPMMIGFCLLVYVLGLLGWRYGGEAYPVYGDVPPHVPYDAPVAQVVRVDYRVLAETWRDRIAYAGWWREDDLSLATLAGRLAVSERTLSRGLNEGLGVTFNAFINEMRIKAVQAELDRGATADILTLALDAGFASKASFNRSFRTFTGMSPTQYRERVTASQNPPIALPGEG